MADNLYADVIDAVAKANATLDLADCTKVADLLVDRGFVVDEQGRFTPAADWEQRLQQTGDHAPIIRSFIIGMMLTNELNG